MNWFQKLRRYIIIKTAENYYSKMAFQCNELYRKTKKHHYIIIEPWQAKRIIITNRIEFRATKRAINDSGMRMSVRAKSLPIITDVTMPDVHSGCFYSSMLQADLDKLLKDQFRHTKEIRKMENEIEARRRAYIQWTLDNAKIRHRKTRKQRREERIVRNELKSIRKGKTK